MEFREHLKQAIDNNPLTISEISKRSGIVRTLIHAIMNGDRRLVPEKSGKLINPRCFSMAVAESLYKSYLTSELTGLELAVFSELIKGLRGETAEYVRKFTPPNPPLHTRIHTQTNIYDTVLRGRENVLGAIAGALLSGTNRLVSDFAFDDVISPLIYRAYMDNKIGSAVHTLCLKNLEPDQKLKSLFAALAFAEAGMETKLDERTGGAWDSYILTDSCFIQYNNDLSQALILPAADAPDRLSELNGVAGDMTIVFKGVFDAVISNEMELPVAGHRDLFAISDVISECFVSNESVLRSLSSEVPQQERMILAQGLRNHFEIILGRDFYEGTKSNTLRCAIPDTAIVEFAEKGRIKDAPEYFFPDVPYDVRAEMLSPFLSHPNASISVIDSRYFGRMRTNIEGNSENLTLVGVSGGDIDAPEAFKDIRVVLRDRDLSAMVMKVFRYFINSYYCMEKTVGDAFIRHQIIKLNALAAGEMDERNKT